MSFCHIANAERIAQCFISNQGVREKKIEKKRNKTKEKVKSTYLIIISTYYQKLYVAI